MKVETKYCEIADHLKEEIRTGKYPPGSVFPSLKMICRRFGVSYLTAVKALESLKDLGLVKSQNGVGTFVAAIATSLRAAGSIPTAPRAATTSKSYILISMSTASRTSWAKADLD